ncbi:IS21 family transposase [Salmonella enterica]|nr:IS21 family transposase [Salmonella enterica]EIK1908113.1 IS21 family transposase [Salmonella enterica]
MPAVPISMRKLKEILRLKYGLGLSHRLIAQSLVISPSVVSRYANRAAQLGIKYWPLPPEWDDATLHRAFLKTQVKMKKHSLPDWATVHKELRNKCVTLQLLWEEYTERNPGGSYSYNHYCRMYREWLKTTSPSMRQVHKAGEKLFVDYCGPTVNITNPDTGEIRTAQIIVAVLGASSYTWAEATWSQQLEDWVMSHARCFQWLGGVPELVVPDNLKSATSRACKYDPDVNPTYQQMLEHYNIAVIPARPRKPKDKAKAEVGVQVVERWIMARIRHETFYSLASLNQRIRELLERLNNKIMQKLGGSRADLFTQLDKPALKPLPEASYNYTLVKKVRVHADYHVEIDKHYYSVPCSLLGLQLEAWISGELVRLFNQGQEVATHPRNRNYGYSTREEHMPEAHRQHATWTPERLLEWAGRVGSETHDYVLHILNSRPHPEQSYRFCLGLLNLHKKYSKARLNAACARALKTQVWRLAGIKSILEKGLDKQPVPENKPDLLSTLEHENVRGSKYYH